MYIKVRDYLPKITCAEDGGSELKPKPMSTGECAGICTGIRMWLSQLNLNQINVWTSIATF